MDYAPAWISEASLSKQPGPNPDTPVADALLTIGRIVAAHGLRGEVKVALATDRPEKLADIRRIYLSGDDQATRISSIRLQKNNREALIKLQGINDRTSAERLRNRSLLIRGNQLPPPEADSYFHYQILGLLAVDEDGHEFGKVTDIIDAGEVDVYVVRDVDKREHLFPALREVVLEIDPEAGRMVIRPQRYAGES